MLICTFVNVFMYSLLGTKFDKYKNPQVLAEE